MQLFGVCIKSMIESDGEQGQQICILGLKQTVILVFEYSFGFQTSIPNILFTRRCDKMSILSDKITVILVEC